MKTLTIVVDESFVETLDKLLQESKLYSSRSEFLKDAIREKMIELLLANKDLRPIYLASRKLAAKAKAAGWNGKPPTREQREQAFQEFLKEKGFT